MIKCIFFLLPVFLVLCPLRAQDNTVNYSKNIFVSIKESSPESGTITIHQDSRVEQGLMRYNEASRALGLKGFRIRIFTNSGPTSKQKALQEKKRFFELYPQFKSYLVYDSPNFKIYVGDFRTKSEALKAHQSIVKSFKDAFIISETINP